MGRFRTAQPATKLTVKREWEGFFTLVPQRGGEQPDRFGDPASSLEELRYSIGMDDLFLTMPAHLRPPSELVHGFRTVAAATVTAERLDEPPTRSRTTQPRCWRGP